MIDEKIIKKMIDNNYIVLNGFEVADGDMSFSDYLKHITTKNKESKD